MLRTEDPCTPEVVAHARTIISDGASPSVTGHRFWEWLRDEGGG